MHFSHRALLWRRWTNGRPRDVTPGSRLGFDFTDNNMPSPDPSRPALPFLRVGTTRNLATTSILVSSTTSIRSGPAFRHPSTVRLWPWPGCYRMYKPRVPHRLNLSTENYHEPAIEFTSYNDIYMAYASQRKHSALRIGPCPTGRRYLVTPL